MITALLSTAPWLMLAAALLWLHSLRSENFGHVDILWPLHHIIACFGVCVALPQLEWRGILLLSLVTAWGIRLATFLAVRAVGREEDRRYAAIRANQGPSFKFTSLFIIYLLQAMIALIICAAFVPIVESAAPWRLIDSALFALMLFGLLYEIVADLQLSAFLKQQSAPGQQDTRLLRTGLWSLSRHPNYFGDWCFWLGISLLALSTGSWLGLVTIGLVSWLLLRFTGVARMETGAPERRPDYQDYQQQTPAFFPVFLQPQRLMRNRKNSPTKTLLILLCCAPLLLLNQPSMAIPASSEHWYFKAFIDDREVGYHSFDVTRDGRWIYLSSRADFEYRLLRIPLFSYTHQVRERYDENFCLDYIESSTETRREKIALNGQRTQGGFTVNTIEGGVGEDLSVPCLTTFAYWSTKLLSQNQLLNGQDGRLMPVTIEPITTDETEDGARKSYRLRADSLDLTLHYSVDGQWLGLESLLPAGRRLIYKLENYRAADAHTEHSPLNP